jgi:hypothetical protein
MTSHLHSLHLLQMWLRHSKALLRRHLFLKVVGGLVIILLNNQVLTSLSLLIRVLPI